MTRLLSFDGGNLGQWQSLFVSTQQQLGDTVESSVVESTPTATDIQAMRHSAHGSISLVVAAGFSFSLGVPSYAAITAQALGVL